jgi:nucleoside 2-deoxyribosyltransferase
MMNLYLAGPITGCTYKGATNWRALLAERAKELGYNVYSPMRGKEHLSRVKRLRPHGYDNPTSTDKAIMRRDSFDVRRADVVLANLHGAEIVSIGTMFELAWGYILGKFVLVVMDDTDKIHDHAFVEQSASTIVESLEDAERVLEVLAGSL